MLSFKGTQKPYTLSRSEFFNLGTVDIWSQVIICDGYCPVSVRCLTAPLASVD